MAFYILEALMSKYQLKDYLTENMPKLKLSLYQLEKLIQVHLPHIHKLLQKNAIPCELFAVRWLVTLFGCDLTPPYLYTVWDVFLLRGWKFLFQFALSVLDQLGKRTLLPDYERLVFCLKNSARESCQLQARALREALSYRVTNKELAQYQTEYETSCKETVRGYVSALPSPPREEKPVEAPLFLVANSRDCKQSRNCQRTPSANCGHTRNSKDLNKSCSKAMGMSKKVLKENCPLKMRLKLTSKKRMKVKKGLFKENYRGSNITMSLNSGNISVSYTHLTLPTICSV
eukprot:TRINITY_DN13833_c0_g1_i3.p2 TRINITY_DN13833_c0_g1~~TRINITY_DN13833_c0_g1_i3.p2  ORF type:complete len:288 (-),score=53.90 TRINITY_DN13833_c0_g1_i3:51-914(-)